MRRAVFVILGVLAVVAASCGGDDPQSARPEDTLDGQGSSSEVTSSSSTTTSTSTTTTSPPTDEELALEVHTRFMTELSVGEQAPDEERALVEELTTGDHRARLLDAIAANEASGEYLTGPGYDSNPQDPFLSEEQGVMVVQDCSQDRNSLQAADDTVLVPADDFHKWRETWLVEVEPGVWKVTDFITGGDNRCEPED